MQITDIAQFEDGFVIHLATEDRRINAYTLASMLIGLADAAKAANSTINTGHDIEIVVEALGPGSFRAKIRAIYDTAHNLFSNQAVQVIILGIITNFIYERTLSVHQDLRVDVQTDEVVVEHGNERIVIPRKVYDGTRIAEKNPQFVGAIGRTMESLSNDQHVTGMAFVPHMDSPVPDIVIPRDVFPQIVPSIRDEGNTRLIEENCDLQIVKAILVRERRKWEFRWRGVKISAPVLDQQFYTEFFAHNIKIAPGDELKVRLLIRQTKDEETGIYANVGYDVVKVFEHIPRVQQTQLTQDIAH